MSGVFNDTFGAHSHNIRKQVTQASHGFSVGDVIYRDSGAYAKAKADDVDTSNVVGIVSGSIDANTFLLLTEGYITGLSSLTDNVVYYLSDSVAGALTATEPSTTDHVRKPLLIADGTTSGYFHICEGSIVGAGVSAHASSHEDGGADELSVLDLGGYPADDTKVLLGDGSWGDAPSGSEWSDQTTYLKPATDAQNVRVYDGSEYSELSENVLTLQERSDAPSTVAGHFQVYGKTVISVESYTKLLLHCNGTDGSTTIIDDCGKTATVYGNAQLDTGQKKFGTASLLCDGTGDVINFAASDDFNFGSGSFTIDFWIRFNSVSGTQHLVAYTNSDGSDSPIDIFLDGSTGRMYFQAWWSGAYQLFFYCDAGMSVNQWYHFALVRNVDTWYMFVDGVSKSLTKSAGSYNLTLHDLSGVFAIGGYSTVGQFNGWIDELRVSKGIARWTSGFTPESAEYNANIYTYSYHVKLPNGTEKTVTLT